MPSIDNLITLLKNKARGELEKTGEYKPKGFFFLQLPDMPNPIFYLVGISTFFDTTYGNRKHMIPAYFANVWAEKKREHNGNVELLAAAVISDSFYSQHVKPDWVDMSNVVEFAKTKPRPSQDPNRREALHWIVCYPAKTISKVHFYQRTKRGVEFQEVIEPETFAETWMTQLYPK
jgi:hypothetical protein